MPKVVDVLLAGLRNPAPIARIETLRVLAMVEETESLPVLRELARSETDSDVLAALKWAGSLIYRAQQSGYTTEIGMRQYFRMRPEPTEAEKREAELLERMQHQFEMDMLREQQASSNNKIGRKVVMGAMGAAFSMPLLGASILAAGTTNTAAASGADIVRAAKEEKRPEFGATPIDPQRPATTDVTLWLRQLEADDAVARQRAAIELRSLNNPTALMALGARYALDAVHAVRDEAQRAGKALYFNWVYWAPKGGEANAASASTSDVANILAKAEAARAARKAKK